MSDDKGPKFDGDPDFEIELAESVGIPGAWTVEAIDDDGGIEQAIFLGPRARERAEAYAAFQYGPRH